jgi:hypothetical protein
MMRLTLPWFFYIGLFIFCLAPIATMLPESKFLSLVFWLFVPPIIYIIFFASPILLVMIVVTLIYNTFSSIDFFSTIKKAPHTPFRGKVNFIPSKG